ncbi:Gfo/Idh/MocA family protein [Natronohydrobacter thiooxidans]|uniref:Gfo/Idh/MocA family protein n=1 Tax=Natronohydrobacter thiooxidans TaxID=87172 RepID=UPI0008FF10D5|nr:Gfo/Idh/MocA family oxidoreductase [Natronohydrobacter thiooxidans]
MKIALVGIGKIALDQHVPALAASDDWELAATVSRSGRVEGVEHWQDLGAMLEARPDIRVISLCLPPVPRFEAAMQALQAGRFVMLEKPPGATLGECHLLRETADRLRLGAFATWHSREAAMVAPAKAWLADKTIRRGHITWREDVRKWHPGQDWVFEPGGMGVFDPGINALSILTEILPVPVRLTGAALEFPENRQAPIAAKLRLTNAITADFDWRQEGPQTWHIEIETDQGGLALHDGGARLKIDGAATSPAPDALAGEYPRLYRRMAELVRAGRSDMDLRPMTLVADAFLLGTRQITDAFHF